MLCLLGPAPKFQNPDLDPATALLLDLDRTFDLTLTELHYSLPPLLSLLLSLYQRGGNVLDQVGQRDSV